MGGRAAAAAAAATVEWTDLTRGVYMKPSISLHIKQTHSKLNKNRKKKKNQSISLLKKIFVKYFHNEFHLTGYMYYIINGLLFVLN